MRKDGYSDIKLKAGALSAILHAASRLALLAGIFMSACRPAPMPSSSTATPKPAASLTLSATSGPDTTPAVSTAPNPINVDAAKLRGLKIRFWYAWAGDAGEMAEKLAGEFNATNPWGIWVYPTRSNSYEDLYSAVQSQIGKPLQPDVITGSMEQALAWNSERDMVVDLSPFIQDPDWGFSAQDIRDFPAGVWKGDEFNGAHLGIPAERSTRLMVYNQTWAKELGFSNPPTTFNSFEQQACAAGQSLLKDGISENNGMGGWLIDGDADTAATWLLAFGSPLSPTKPGEPYRYHTPQTEAAFQYLRKLFDSSCIWLGRDPDSSVYFADRRALFITIQSEDLPGLTGSLETAGSKDAWTVLPFPSQDGKPVVMVHGPSYLLLRSTPAQELAAWLFMRWISAPEQQMRLAQAGSWPPLRMSTYAKMSDYAKDHPQWKAAAELMTAAQSSPNQTSWRIARSVLRDAYMQLFGAEITAKQIPDLLSQLDTTIQEILEKGAP